MEQNKRVFRWLLISAAVLTVASAICVAMLAPIGNAAEKIAIVASIVFPEALCMVLVSLSIRHPEINHHYTLRRQEGRWRLVRRIYAPDPYGLRYAAYGKVLLLMALLFAVVAAEQIWGFQQWIIVPIVAVIVVLLIVIIERCERKLSAGNE